MQIWVDGDACPNAVKEILYRAAQRLRLPLTLVANHVLRTPPSPFIKSMLVPAGFNVADDRIVGLISAGDLVVTGDIPLAAAVLAKGAHALNPRGELYHPDTIAERLTMRNFMDELRGSGVETGGPAPLGPRDRQNFANQLDRLLASAANSR